MKNQAKRETYQRRTRVWVLVIKLQNTAVEAERTI